MKLACLFGHRREGCVCRRCGMIKRERDWGSLKIEPYDEDNE